VTRSLRTSGATPYHAACPRPGSAALPGGPIDLRKWYLDVVTDDGTAAILYWATVKVSGVRLGYAATLVTTPDGDRLQSATPFAGDAPDAAEDGTIAVRHSELSVDGTWDPLDRAAERTLLDTDAGAVRWHALAPRCRVTCTIGDRTLTGLGYVELLTLTLPPWKLPIDTLHWGRLLTAEHSATWIRWEGAHPLSVLLVDGAAVEAPTIDTHALAWPGGRATLETRETMRDGPIGPKVLSAVPGIAKLAPASLLLARETKWRSEGRLVLGDDVSHGQAIHEVVRFRTEDDA